MRGIHWALSAGVLAAVAAGLLFAWPGDVDERKTDSHQAPETLNPDPDATQIETPDAEPDATQGSVDHRVEADVPRTLHGRLTHNGTGVASAAVAVVRDTGELAETTSKASGEFELTIPVESTRALQLRVRPRPPLVARLVPLPSTDEVTIELGDIQLEAGVLLSGIVVGELDEPLRDAVVSLQSPEDVRAIEHIKTDTTGRFRIGPVPLVPAGLKVEHEHYIPGHSESFHYDTPGELFIGTIKLEAGRRLDVVVLNRDEAPVAKASVSLRFDRRTALKHLRKTRPDLAISAVAASEVIWICKNAALETLQTNEAGAASFAGVPLLPATLLVETRGVTHEFKLDADQREIQVQLR